MKNKIYKKIVLPLLSGLLAVTTGCSNIPVVNSVSITNTAQSISLSKVNQENDLNSIFNSEYKRFSTKSADNNTESISLSKRYVLSTKTVTTYQPSDNDSGGQPPNRIKITADIKKTNATSGINFVIDGVTTFTAPSTADPFTTGMGTVIDYNANYFRYEFIWDGKYTDGRTVEDGVYAVHAIKPSGNPKSLGLDIEVEVTSDPLIASGLEFYKPEDFSLLASKVGELEAPEVDANKLYDVVQEIEVLNTKISNLQSRPNPDTAKITALQSELSSKNTQKTALESSLTSSINALSTKKDGLRSYVNTITKNSTFVENYTLSNKPTSLSQYNTKIFNLDVDFNANIDDTASIYGSDDINNSQSLISPFSKDNEIKEKVDVYPVLNSSIILIHEVNILKDLLNDLSSNTFTNSKDVKEASFLIKYVSNKLKKQSQYLNVHSKKISNDLKRKYDSMYQDMKDLHQSIQIPIALAMREESSMQNNPYVIQALKPLPNKFTVQSYTEWVDNLGGLISTFNSLDPLSPVKERAIRYVMHYDQAQWDALPQSDRDELKATFSEVVSAVIPTTPSEIVTNLAFAKILKVAGKVSKATIGIFKKKPTTAIGMLDELDDINKAIRKEQKIVSKEAKTISVICNISKAGIRVLSADDCPDPNVIKASTKIRYSQDSLSKHFKDNGGKMPNNAIELDELAKSSYDAFKSIDYNSLDNEAKLLYNQLDTLVESTKTTGIPIKKYLIGDHEMYFPDFNSFKVIEVKFSTVGKKFDGDNKIDDAIGRELGVKEMFQKGFLKNDPNDPSKLQDALNEFEVLQDKLKLAWHHFEDLDTYMLIPRTVHQASRHAGARSIIRKLEQEQVTNQNSWRTLLGFPSV